MPTRDEVAALFRLFDTDGNGFLSPAELKAIFCGVGREGEDEEGEDEEGEEMDVEEVRKRLMGFDPSDLEQMLKEMELLQPSL